MALPLTIYNGYDNVNPTTGYIDELRTSNIARDPATFPPTAEYSSTTTYTKTLTVTAKVSSSFIRGIKKVLRTNAKVSSTAKNELARHLELT